MINFILPILKLSSLLPHAFAWWFNCYSGKEWYDARGTHPSIPLQVVGMPSPALVQTQGTSAVGLEMRPQHLSSDLSCVILCSEIFATVNLSVTHPWRGTVVQHAGQSTRKHNRRSTWRGSSQPYSSVEDGGGILHTTNEKNMSGLYCMPNTERECSWNAQTNDTWWISNKTNLIIIFLTFCHLLYILVWNKDVKSKLIWVLNHGMFIDKIKYPNPFFVPNLFLAIISRHSIQSVYLQLSLPKISKATPLLSKVCSTVNGWCAVINQIWIITDQGQQL